ncbi:extracellular solute-binding protein [Mucilaginibacter aquatilis]|uniref:Extracellular solute-binding protein n=1 Tax=Mucilaginibacter aquatilis TaxID=1517760 RepID=A0A6I4ICW8_9SPHI|nr:extracellular solute-binding protein [Mucilaginibacter aquatilis]MVN93140.1 extracellular solute-binding protein [Mucilaginibacter aquatilis]
MSQQDTIRIAVRKFGPFESALQKIWDSFCTETGCTLKAEMVPMDLELLYDSIIEQKGLQNGDWDIAHVVTDWLYEAWTTGALLNLQPLIAQNPPEDFPSGWSQSLLAAQQFGESIAGLPFHDGPECFIYRKDLFEDSREQQSYFDQHGTPLRVPQTWDEFQTVARFFNRPEQNLYGTVFAGYPDGHNTVFDFVLQLWTRGGQLTDANGEVNVDTPQAVVALEFFKQLFLDKSAVHPQSVNYESVQMGMAFARGEAAMMVNWFGFASMCEVIAESAVKGKVDVAKLPAAPGTESASLNVYWLYTIGAGSRHKQTAYDFLRFAVNQRNDKLLTLEGGIGCRISTWNHGGVNAIIPYYHKLEELHTVARMLPQKSNWAQITHIIDEAVLAAINTDTAVSQILKIAQQKITQLTTDEKHANTL